MSCLFLTESEVDELLDMPAVIDVVEEAFRRLAEGEADNVPRTRAKAKGIVLHSMSAAADYLGLVGWKQYTTTRGGARFHVGLYDQSSGELVALIEANRLGQLRTGATTGVAARHLAPGSKAMGIFGSGWQAESQLAAVAAACPIERAVVYSRDSSRREDFSRRMSASLGIEVAAVDEPRAAVENLPVVVTATTAREPVFRGEWLSPGALVCAVGSNWLEKAEIDVAAIERASAVVCDSVECCRNEAGDFIPVIDRGVWSWDRAIDLADVVTGKQSPRQTADDVIIFKSVGMALEDLAAGALLLERARKSGAGRELPL